MPIRDIGLSSCIVSFYYIHVRRNILVNNYIIEFSQVDVNDVYRKEY